MGGAHVRLLAFAGATSAAGVVAVLSEFEGERAAVTRENLLAHNRVNAHVLARVTPLPFRFGTLADEARLSAYVAANETALAEAFARVRGCVEMGVKVRLGEDAKGGAKASEVNDEEVKVEEAGVGRGTAFLLSKRREILGGEALKARAEEAAASLAACVEGLAREADVRMSPEGPIVLRASHLVARADVEEYRARARQLGARLSGLHLLTSGPWPPYSFGISRGPAE